MTEPEPWPGAARAGEPAPMPLAWMAPFLAALAESGIVRHAARAADVAVATPYDARTRHPDFAGAWQTAIAGKEYRRASVRRASSTPPQPAGPATAHWRIHFFEALAETSNVTRSAERASIALRAVYKLRRDDPEFAARWRAALLEGYDHLEMELLGHLRNPRPGHRMDVASALRLLAAHRQTVERQRALMEDEDEQAVLDSIDQFIDDMRERRVVNTAILIEAGPDNDAE